jgi:site-specific DNA recombinase
MVKVDSQSIGFLVNNHIGDYQRQKTIRLFWRVPTRTKKQQNLKQNEIITCNIIFVDILLQVIKMRVKSMTKAVGYIRVSTDKQADKGQSLEVQQEKIKAYASLYDIDLVDIVVDAGESAKTLEREGLKRILSMLGKDVDAIIVSKLDRLTRSVKDIGFLMEKHFSKHSLLSVGEQIDTRTAAGRLVLNVLISVAQWERETIGERTSSALQHKASKNEFTGGNVPYGYALSYDGINLIEDAPEQAVIAEAKKLRKNGLSLRAVASELAKRGFLPRSGKSFSTSLLSKMVA